MEAIPTVLNDTKLDSANYDPNISSDISAMPHGNDNNIESTTDEQAALGKQMSVIEKVPSIERHISEEEEETQEKQNDTVDNVNMKLELPDNLDNDDFSKLLDFDPKNDDDLFGTQDILEDAIREADSEEQVIENITSDLNKQVQEDNNEVQENRDGDEDGNDDHSSNTSNNNSHLDSNTEGLLEDTMEATLKEETLSPRRTLSDLGENNTNTRHNNGDDNNNDDDEETNRNELENASKETNLSHDRHTPAAILHEKGNLLFPKRHDSLTPVMFQQHELLPSQQSMHPSSTDTSRPFTKEGLVQDNSAFPDEQPTISAYARLDFQSFTFYVQTLHVIIGRRSENDFSHKVDVNLGPSKSISRRHAQIFYNFGTGRFELSIIGKNGAFVDDIFVERGNTVPVRNKSKIQIGQIPFQFVLPEQEKAEQLQKSPEPVVSAEPEELSTTIKNDKEAKVASDEHSEKKQINKTPIKKEKKPTKVPKRVYTLEEIPVEYRTKPTCSYSALLTTCIRKYSSPKGMSLSEIYTGIRELFPYYKFCPDGWQSSVRHNLSLNKSFRKVSKEGKGWLWGLDEEYIAERERQKKKQAEAAAAKAQAAQQRLEQQQQQRAKKTAASNNAGTVNRSGSIPKSSYGKQQSISQTLAANRAADKSSNLNDHQRTMKYLQEQLMILTKDRKGLSKQVIASILTQALAMTINQVTQAARNKGITGNPLTALMDKNPQHLNLILAAAVNAATSKVTNGKVKQLVSIPSTSEISKQVKNPNPTMSVNRTTLASPSDNGNTAGSDSIRPANGAKSASSSFDPSSLSRFFQPRQPARIPPVPTVPLSMSTLPQKRSHEKDEGSSSDESSGSNDDEEEDGGTDDGDADTDEDDKDDPDSTSSSEGESAPNKDEDESSSDNESAPEGLGSDGKADESSNDDSSSASGT